MAAQYIKWRPINIQPSSDESIAQARQWIYECLLEHDDCPDPADSALPTRLVEILDDERLILHENSSRTERGTYTTMSYRWGGPQTFATTTDTYESHIREGFKVSDLPQTLQDGVFLTRRLGLRYVWIDSLCILQDSDEDKERELPRLAAYYKDAYVTICAAVAESCHDGFLQTHDECKTHPGTGIPSDLLRMPFLDPSGNVGEMLFRETCPYSLAWEPLEKRAWTFQERILSPRILHYGKRTLWQCHHHQRSHGGVEDFSLDTRSFDYRGLQARIQQGPASKRAGADAEEVEADLYALWHQAVHAYGVRDLTYPHDKLPAIAGLASEFARVTGDEYLAGLWRRPLLRELLWSTWPNLVLVRPEERRAPSWSWASVDNDITYDRLPPADARAIATILSCSVTPMYADSVFGRNRAGVLEIEGLLVSMPSSAVKSNLQREYMIPGPDPARGFATLFMWDRIIAGNGKGFGSNEDWEPPERCVYLPLFAMPEGDATDRYDVHGLVLAEKEDGTYERIADFTNMVIKGLDEMLEAMKKKVVIV